MPPAKPKNQRGLQTNLASEFYVLSALQRLGFHANLTLGNKKGVDIVVAAAPGQAFTVEVKAVAGKNDWLVGRLGESPMTHHYVVLVCYEARFEEPDVQPTIWVFAHDDIVPFIQSSKTGSARYISRKRIREEAFAHAQKWEILPRAAV